MRYERIVLPIMIVIASVVLACGSGEGGGTEDSGFDASVPQDNGLLPDQSWGEFQAQDPGTTDQTQPPDTGNDPGTTPKDTMVTDPGQPDPGPTTPKCQAIAAGTVTGFDVDGKARTFLLHLPADAEGGGPWPVVFNWHGVGDTAQNMAGLLSGKVNNPDYPFILVTPEDTNIMPPGGMDWDILTVTEPNQEARLFDEVLACLDQRFGVDWERIHSVGFSAGSIMVDLLGVLRGEMLASIATYSGVYFSNQPNVDALGTLAGFVSWPEMPTGSTYTQLLVHGGKSDNYNMMIVTLQFDESGKRDVTWLAGFGHDVIHCDHSGGHTVPYAFNDGGSKLVDFFKSHPRTAVGSPWSAHGLPAGYPDYCEVAGR